ncbi:MBG domain-containing protein [Levilactobacillus parabrevis]|uniref:MBG domain-containing protein n=1 Tax=Levilactobacillus parabrevis TaxID=357278 RepID=UPI0037574872
MRQKAANQTAKKNFILYKGHTGWKIKTRLFGTLLVGLSAVAIAESTGTVNVYAATGDAPVADTSPSPAPTTTGSTTLGSSKTDGTTPATTTPAPKEPAATAPTDATPATQSYSPASISAESADISASKVAASATADAATPAKQYQTLTPDQSMSVGKTDGSGVTLSGSEVQDHFTNKVETLSNSKTTNLNDPKVAAAVSAANTKTQAANSQGVWQLTTPGTHNYTDPSNPGFSFPVSNAPQVAHVSFENEIDFDHNFSMTGALGIGTTTGGADGVGIVFAPGDPEYATTGKSGGNLGLGGLNNAFAFVYDDHYNDGDDTSGVVDPGNSAYFGWRSTDANGVIQKVTNANDWKAASAFDLSNRATDPLMDFTMSYNSFTKVLTMDFTNQHQSFTRSLAGIDTSKGYSISIAASTGQDKNDYSARIDSFTYTPKTASVNVTVADATAGDTPVSTTTPVTANIGDTISVFSTKEAAERAVAADPTLDPSLVTVIPASTTSNVYVVDGDQATASNGTVHASSLADASYYSYKVTGDANQAFSVPISQAFTAKVTPVDSVTGEAIPGMDPIQVTTVAGKSVVVQVPGYTPVTVVLDAPAAGETVAQDKVKINTGTTASTETDVANPIEHYYTATGETIDGTPVTAKVTVGTNQSVTDALNATPIGEDGKAITDGSTPAYTWSTVPNAAGTDSTDSTTPQDSKSILVPTQSTLDKWIQQATDNQTKADTEKAAAQDIYDKFVASPDITDEQKTAAKSLLDSVNNVYDQLSKTNADAKASLKDAENSSDPATIVKDSQDGYAGISGMDTSLSEFKKDVDNMSTTNAATQASMVSFSSWSQDYGTPLENPKAIFGDGFGVTVSADQLAGLFADPNNFYYVDALASDTHVTPKNVGTYYFKLTEAGRSYIKSLTPDNPNAGLYVSGTVTITPAAAAPTINAATVVYGGNDGKLPEISGSLGTKVAGADDVLTQDDYEVVDTDSKAVVPVDQLQAGGKYTIRYTAKAQADLKADNNYTITDFGTSTLTVTPRDITVTAPTVTKTYGESDPKFELTGVSSGELVNNDHLSDLGVTLNRDAGENVKAQPYTISADPTSKLNNNYTITVTPGSLTIDKKSVTVTANDVATTYNGSAPATNGYSVPDDALAPGDTSTALGVTLNQITKTDAGTYPDAVTGTATSDNYDVKVTPGKLTITQATSSVDLGSATMVYGDAYPTFTSTDNVPGTTSTITQPDFEIVDTTGNTVGASKVQANGKYTLQLSQTAKNRLISENPNYAITFGTSTLTVNPRPVSVTAKNIDKTYGDADPDLELTDTSTGASTGLVAGDDLGVKLTRTSGENVGSYNITNTSSDLNPNYAVNFTPGTFTINPADGNVAVTGTTMTYGDSLPSLSVSVNGPDASEQLGADNFEFVDTTTHSVVKADKLPAGSYTVQLTKVAQDTLSKANGNFTLTFGTGTLTVNKRPITVNINDVTTDYDGSAHGANGFSIAAGDKLVDGESSDELGVKLAPISETDIGTYTITGTADSANYAVTVNNGTLKILGNDKDAKGNVTITEKDAAGNVVRIDKQWADGSETIYKNDNGKLTVTDKKGDKTLDQQPFNPAGDPLTLTDDPNTNTIVALDPTTKLPAFSHETTATNEAGDTTTTTDAEGNVVKVVKQWPDGTQTTYKYDTLNKGKQTVTDSKDGQTVDEKTFATDPKTGKPETTATVSNGDDIQTIVNVSEPGAVPTFEHDTTQTSKDDSGTVTATTKDDAGNVVKVVKTWSDGSKTTYTDVNGQRTVTEENGGNQIDEATLGDNDTATLKSGDGVQTIVNTGKSGSAPTFEHDTTVTTKDDAGNTTATTKDADGKVVKVVKQWTDGSQTTYTDENGQQTVTEEKDGEQVDQKKFVTDPTTGITDATETLKTGDGVQTIVKAGESGSAPTFVHETTKTDGDTTTTKDAEGNVVKAVKQWPDGTQTTYTYDPLNDGKQTVTGSKDGQTVDEKTLATDPKTGNPETTATVSNGDDIQTIVNVSKPGAAPTFEHDTTQTTKDGSGNVVATTKDDAGNVVKVVKQWPGDSQTTYTYDPGTKVQKVTEEKDGKQVDQATLVTDDPTTGITAKATLNSGDAAQTIVNPVEPGQMPTFEHDTTDTVTDNDITTATTKDDAGNTVKVVKNWPDGTQTTYKLDPSTGKGDVSEQKNGKTIVDSQEIPADSHKVTITDDDKTSTIVTYDPTTKLATFEHDTTDTTTDDSGIVTTVTKDNAGNVIKVVKTWPKDNSTTTYTYDPTSSKATITEVNNGKEIDRQEEVSSPSTTTLKSGDGVETIVNTGQPGEMPTFEHDTTVTVTDKLGNVTATTKNVAGDIVKVDQKWKDGSETIYTNDNGKQMVNELRNGKSVAQKPLEQQPVDPDNPDATRLSEVTLPDGAGGTVTVKLDQPDAAPTFTHAPASYSAGVSAPAKDADKVVKITKKWPDGLQVVYTYDPVSGDRIVSELKNGKLIVQRAIEPDALLAVLPDGKGGSATVKFGKNGVAAPIFTRQLADKAVAARKYAAIYALKKIGFYSDPNFSKATRLHWYTKQRRPNRPQFVVIGYARSKAGTLRYHVRAANGKTGYITANSKFVSNTYYKSQPKTIRVIGKHGINAYNRITMNAMNGKAVRHYKRGTKLTVKKIQKHNLTTRLVLSNGTYISGNKTLVIAK